MNLPSEVPHGRPVGDLTQAVNALIRYCRSITPRPSATVGVSTLSNGTTFRVKGGDAGVGSRNVQVQIVGLNQFQVTCRADSEYEPEGDERRFLVSVVGGTAQQIYGEVVECSSIQDEPVVLQNESYKCYISIHYRILNSNNEYVHNWDDVLDIFVGERPRQNTLSDSYYPIAMVDYGGNVLQGHLGAVFLTYPRSVVDVPD